MDYYSEMIDDRIKDRLSEEEAVAAMGSIDDIVSQILMDTSLPKLVKAKAQLSRSLQWWEIVLLIIGAPIWAPLLFSAIIVRLALYLTVWALIITFYAVDLTIALGCLIGFFGGTVALFFKGPGEALLCLGIALILAGIAILLFFACNLLSHGAFKLSSLGIQGVKHIFIGRGNEK